MGKKILIITLITILPFTLLCNKKHSTDNSTKFQIIDLVKGTGETPHVGSKITVHYKGTLLDGTVFDSSYKSGKPFSFILGVHQVIRGWDEGFKGMKVGGKRKLIIPPEMGYGARKAGRIPPNSTLVFEVELLKVE